MFWIKSHTHMALVNMIRPLQLPIMALVAMILLSACGNELSTPNRITQTPLQLQEQIYQQIIPLSEMSDGLLRHEAELYRRQGAGEVDIRVTYNPQENAGHIHRNNAPKANDVPNDVWALQQSRRLARQLKDNGVDHIRADILPIKDLQDPQVILRYQSFIIEKPEECSDWDEELHNRDPDKNYVIGCTSQSIMAKQIYRSRDLKDNASAFGENNADRFSLDVDVYRSGARVEDFEAVDTTDPTGE